MSDADVNRRLADLETLLDVSRRLGATTELTPLLEQIAEAAITVLGCERATVFIYDPPKHELYSEVATGTKGIRFSADHGIAGECVRTGSIINVPDAYADPRFNRDIDRVTGYRTRNLLTFPMRGHQQDLVGVLQVLNKRSGAFNVHDEELAGTLSSLAGVAVQRQILLDEYAEKKKLERDLDLAREIQQSLLPTSDPQVPGFDIAGFNQPADATGGDCYDFIPLADGSLAIVLADATGHGIGPALVISQFRAMLRALLRTADDLPEVLRRINDRLAEDIPDGMFVTAAVGVVDPRTSTIHHVSAGQGPLLVYRRAEDSVEELPADTYPLGIVSPMEPIEPTRIHLAPGDVFLLLTDGFYEWTSPEGRQFGTAPVIEVARQTTDRLAAGFISSTREKLKEFAQGTPQKDDLTCVVICKAVSGRD